MRFIYSFFLLYYWTKKKPPTYALWLHPKRKKTPRIWLQLFPASLVGSCNMNCEIHRRIVALWDYYQTENKYLIGLELFQIQIISQIKAHVFELSQPWCRILICWKWMEALETFLKKNETLKFKHYSQTNKLEEASPKKPKPKSRRAVGTKALANLIRNAKCCFQKVTVNGTQILFYVTQIIDPSYYFMYRKQCSSSLAYAMGKIWQ